MECQRINAILDEHAAGSLRAAERAEVAAHLDRCPRCADAWLAHETLASDVPDGPRPAFRQAVREAALQADAKGVSAETRRRPGAALGLAAAALIGLVVAGVLVTDAPPESVPAVTAESNDSPSRPGGAAEGTANGDALGNTPIFRPAVPGLIAGIHYERLPAPAPTSTAPGRIEVCEFFMFGCIHCYELESALVAWEADQADDVELVRVPAIFNPLARLHAQAYYTAEVLGRGDALIAPFYTEIHERGNALASRAALREFFARHGIDGARFDATFDSAAVAERLRQAEALNRRYGIGVTPSIGINGQYLTSPSMTGSTGAMLDAVDTLVEAEREALASCPGGDGDRCPLDAVRPRVESRL